MLNIMGKVFSIDKPTTLLELAPQFQYLLPHPIILAKVNNRLKDLSEVLDPLDNYNIEFLDISDPNGYRAYQRSAVFLLVYSIKSLYGPKTSVIVEHSINKNYYCEINGLTVTPDLLSKVKSKMRSVASLDIPFLKFSLPIESVLRLINDSSVDDKRFIYNRNSFLSLYKLDWFYDYFYGPMLPSTSYLSSFDLSPKLNGFVLHFPSFNSPYFLQPIKPNTKVSQVFLEYSNWLKILNLHTLSSLNELICRDKSKELIYLSEALHENKIVNIASQISDHNKKIILIGGPTSSGKTTFSYRLSLQLRVNGKKPILISIDDYFLNREDSPLDENGKHDFERIDALDIPKLNQDLSMLLAGKEIELPKFNFVTGHREKSGRFVKLNDDDILIMEGIHGLNEKLTAAIPRDLKFKIFASALTQLNIDDHNRISTTDTRLVRRIVRDNQFRAFKAKDTIQMWKNVVRGENNYIFPYQEEADAFFNSALVYEMSALKQFALPLLFAIPDTEEEFTEANRLIRFLNLFLTVNTKYIPANSILREFIGGSCFY